MNYEVLARDPNEGGYRTKSSFFGAGSDFDQLARISDPEGEDHCLLETYVVVTG